MILAQLRTATSEDHRLAEAAMPSLDALASADGYAWSLRALHGFFMAWEPRLFAALAPLAAQLDLASRHKLPLLVSDLEALSIEPAPEACAAPAQHTLALPRSLGAMYVLEGSTLGGQVIERHCAPRVGVSADHGGAFYHGYGTETGARWKAFGTELESYVDTHGGEEDIVGGARDCFHALGSWLDRLTPFRRSGERVLVG